MTREQATIRCEDLNRERQDGQRWFVSQAGTDEWHVVAVALPAAPGAGPRHASIESHPAPQNPPDPRPSLLRNIPPYGA
jgi:hypothetical protein